MDSAVKRRLEERIVEEMQTMLTEGDRPHLRELSRDALLETIETELKFLGLYSHDDQETPAMIHMILLERFDQLCEEYLYGPTVQLHESPFIQIPCSTEAGFSKTSLPLYVGFKLPMDRPKIQVEASFT